MNPTGEVGTSGWEGVCVLRFVSYNWARAANMSVAVWHFSSEMQELRGCQSLERQQTSPLRIFWKSAPKKCILILNYSNGLASCPDNLHAVLLVEKNSRYFIKSRGCRAQGEHGLSVLSFDVSLQVS